MYIYKSNFAIYEYFYIFIYVISWNNIESEQVTNWGDWNKFAYCEGNKNTIGFTTKFYPYKKVLKYKYQHFDILSQNYNSLIKAEYENDNTMLN